MNKDSYNFIKAVKEKDYSFIEKYLKENGDVNCTTNVGTSALMWAVRNNDVNTVDTLLKHGAKIDIVDYIGNTALIYCCQFGNKVTICKMLLAANAQVNIKNNKGETALDYAYKANDKEVIQLLLSAGAKPATDGFNALVQAVNKGNIEIVNKLLKSSLVNTRLDIPQKDQMEECPRTLLTLAVENQHAQIAEILLQKGANIIIPIDDFCKGSVLSGKGLEWVFYNCPTAKKYIENNAEKEFQLMELAIKSGNPEIVIFVLEKGGNATGDDITDAITLGHQEIVKVLLQVGVGPDAAFSNPLEDACNCDNIELVRMLVAAGSNVNERFKWGDRMDTYLDWHPSALMVACRKGNLEMAKFLLDAGAEVNIPPRKLSKSNPTEHEYYCDSPLMSAVRINSLELAELLLQRGADITYKNEDGETALSVALQKENNEMISLLKSAGAKE